MDTQYLMLVEAILDMGVAFGYIGDTKLLEAINTYKRKTADYVEVHPPPVEPPKTPAKKEKDDDLNMTTEVKLLQVLAGILMIFDGHKETGNYCRLVDSIRRKSHRMDETRTFKAEIWIGTLNFLSMLITTERGGGYEKSANEVELSDIKLFMEEVSECILGKKHPETEKFLQTMSALPRRKTFPRESLEAVMMAFVAGV